MKTSAKSRVLLLSLATFTTLLALTPPKPVKACFSQEVYVCHQSDGSTCLYSEFPCSYNNCREDPATLQCDYLRTTCC